MCQRPTTLATFHSQGLVRLETVVIDDVLSPLGHRLDLPQGARLTPLEVLRVHGDNIAALILLGRHQQLHRGLKREDGGSNTCTPRWCQVSGCSWLTLTTENSGSHRCR